MKQHNDLNYKPVDIGASGPEGCISNLFLGFMCMCLFAAVTAGVFYAYAAITWKMEEQRTYADANEPMPEGWHIVESYDGSGGRVSTPLLDGLSCLAVPAILILFALVLGPSWLGTSEGYPQ